MIVGTPLLTAVIAAMSVALGLPVPVAAGASTAHLETGDLSEFHQVGALEGRLGSTRERSYDGRRSARAAYCGGADNGFARGILRVRWPAGRSVWYGAAYFLPRSFIRNVQGEVDLLRWDDYGSAGEDAVYGGIVIFGSDRRARLVRGTYGGGGDVLSRSFSLPVGRWFWLEVHQRLSDGRSARSEVYVDGRRVDASRRPNAYGTTIDRVRFGIVAITAGEQVRPLTLWLDRAVVADGRIGPRRGTRAAARLPRPQRRGGPRSAAVGRRCGA